MRKDNIFDHQKKEKRKEKHFVFTISFEEVILYDSLVTPKS